MDRLVLAPPFRHAGDHVMVDLPGARALFTTRRGGVSTGPFESLNLGLWTGDRRISVLENRARLTQLAGVTHDGLMQGRQIHGAHVRAVARKPHQPLGPEDGDGQATVVPGLAPIVLVADCLPVALAGAGGVAMLHCGWRGLADGIIAAGVDALRELGVNGPLVAAIGPGAGGCCYEVGSEVLARLSPDDAGTGENGRLDLKLVARRELLAAGVEAVDDVGICTICGDRALWFSHRRDAGLTGRQAGLAWLTK